MKKWIVTDIHNGLKLEIEAPNLDVAIETARNAYPAPQYRFDCAHRASDNPEHNEPYFKLLTIK